MLQFFISISITHFTQKFIQVSICITCEFMFYLCHCAGPSEMLHRLSKVLYNTVLYQKSFILRDETTQWEVTIIIM